jgi:arginine utilization regulatory protein
MRDMIRAAKKFSQTDLPLMIIGETGTGKEIIAQGIHNESRGDRPFVPINCAAIPETLVENVFFGSIKGAFTGATNMKGLFEQANGGTLFLDEVNSLPMSFQPKLLRALQEHRIRRIGSEIETPFDCRIISASNADLLAGPSSDTFRGDLVFRLAVTTLYILPLRERPEDKLMLAKHFIHEYENALHCKVDKMSDNFKQFLETYSWPGNVRELQNVIASSMNMMSIDDADILDASYLPQRYQKEYLDIDASAQPEAQNATPVQQETDKQKGKAKGALAEQVAHYEAELISAALQTCDWNISKTARYLGINRTNLYAKINKYDLKKD